jgi:radical SAM superfamily enzyme YgiQ (UPF0313 family)
MDTIFPWEIVSAQSLNLILKEQMPLVHLNFTGHRFDEFCFARLADRMKSDSRLFFGFDSIFLTRADSELRKLYNLKELSHRSLSGIQSLAYRTPEKNFVSKSVMEGDIVHEDIPDYSDLPLERYFSPHTVFVDKLSSKCYWSRCAFCNINVHKAKRQEVELDTFIERVLHYKKHYNCTHLWLLDEAASPETASRLSYLLDEKSIALTWSLRTRLDQKYDKPLLERMHAAGCRELWIGLETVSPRLLKEMNKTDIPKIYQEAATNLLKHCSEIGIGLHFCLLFGFPTETDDDRKDVFDFFKNNQHFLKRSPFFSTFNIFSLNPGSKVYKQYKKYDIEKIVEHGDTFNMINTPYVRQDGQTAA